MFLAESVTAVGLFVSSHHEPKAAACESNPGVLIEQSEWHWGVVRNSRCRTAPFLHRYWQLGSAYGVKLGFTAGPQLGYHVPFTAFFRLTSGPVTLYVVPPVSGVTHSGARPPVIGLAFRMELK